MTRIAGVGTKREPVIDPVLERPLLGLHRAMNIDSFWKAVQRLLSAAIPNRLMGMTLQHNPILPMITRWTSPMPDGFFNAAPLKGYIAGRPRNRFVRISDVFANRSSLMKSAFYRRYMAPQGCLHAVGLFFWKDERLICVIAIMRTARQGDLSPAEMKLLRQLYPQVLTALLRLRSLEREHSVRMDFEEFLSGLPLPTILLRWNLKLIYQNRAARDFCAVWEKGPEEAKRTKATSPIPFEILDRCRLLKQHSSIGVAQPHFLIECEDLRRQAAPRAGLASYRLPHLAQLTRREQEVARLVCDGRSNQEIADDAGLSLPTVKKHVHGIFRKLEVTR